MFIFSPCATYSLSVDKIKIIKTNDGSQSLFLEDLQETYHSTHGALGESRYVYIEAGMRYLVEGGHAALRVLEVGFGTGLNALLTAEQASVRGCSVAYDTLEPFPIGRDIYAQLRYESLSASALQLMHDSAWNESVRISDFFTIQKHRVKLEAFENRLGYDLIYYDAFAPSKQPEVWAVGNLEKCFDLLVEGGVLVTYCAQGQFKRNLSQCGFKVEVLPGAMGKKEMVRAVKSAAPAHCEGVV